MSLDASQKGQLELEQARKFSETWDSTEVDEINFDLNDYPTLLAAAVSDAYVRTIRGPAGSAKTSWAFVELLRRAAEQAPGADGVRRTKWLIGRLTYQVLLSSTLVSAKKTLGGHFKVREAIPPSVRGQFDLEDGTKIDTVFEFVSLDGDDAFKKLLGFEPTGAFLDEVSEIPEAIVHAVIRRLGRFPSGKMGKPSWVGLIMTTNGPIEGHWLHQWELGENRETLDGLEAEMRAQTGEARPYLHCFAQPPALLRPEAEGEKWKPNPAAENVQNLPGGYVYYYNMLLDSDDAKVKAFVEGDFAPLKKGKVVFPRFRTALHVVPYDQFQPPEGVPLGLSFDFGRTPVCTVYVETASGRLVMVEEVMGEDIAIDGLVREKLKPLLARRYRTSPIAWVTGDPAGADGRDNVDTSAYQVLRDLNFMIVSPGSNRLDPRLEAVNHRLSRLDMMGFPMLQIRSNCTFSIEAMSRTYIYEQISSTDDTVKDIPTKSHVNWVSDLADSIQYACLYNAPSLAPVKARPPLPRLSGRVWG